MTCDVNPWEEFYLKGSPNWRGSPYDLPDLKEGTRYLDVGCGTGSTLIKAVERGWIAKGIDISPSALEVAGDRLGRRGLKADLVCMDISKDRLEGGFDLISLHYVLGAMKNDGRRFSVKNILKVMTHGGHLTFEDLAVGDVRENKGERIEERTRLKGNGIIQHFFEIDEVREIFGSLKEVRLSRDTWEHGGMKRARIVGMFQFV